MPDKDAHKTPGNPASGKTRGAHVLVLGGTGQGRALAAGLARAGFEVTLSLAGATRAPRLAPGASSRVGGFGGAAGLARWISGNNIALVADATHPFAARMGRNAFEAAQAAGAPLIRLERPLWRPGPDDIWFDAPSIAAAARMPPGGARVFAALGGRGLAGLAGRGDLWLYGRVMSEPDFAPPPRWRVWRARPGRSVAGEMALLRACRAQWLICRNSGGAQGRAKLLAARRLALPVVMIRPPMRPCERAAQSVEELIHMARLITADH